MRYSKTTRVEMQGDLVILINTLSGEWYRVTNECFQFIDNVLNSDDDVLKKIDELCSGKERRYFLRIFNELEKREILVRENQVMLPSMIGFSITHRCNLNCNHCSYNAGNIYEAEKRKDKDIIGILDKIISLNPRMISITGGEPLVRKNINEICNKLKNEYSGICNLMTNAVLINEENVDMLVNTFTSFDISLDGIDEKSCQNIRGKGVFDQVIKSIIMLTDHGFDKSKISLSMVLTTYNEKLVDKFEKLNNRLGTNPIYRSYSYSGRGLINNLVNINNDDFSCINTEAMDLKNITALNCSAISEEIFIDCDGEIYPCPMHVDSKYSLGNVLNINNLKDYLKEEKYKNKKGFINFKHCCPEYVKKCNKCEYKYFCITCPLQHNEYMQQDFFSSYCNIKKKHLSNIWRR